MNESLAADLISKYFPEFSISKINKIGEGTGNTAFEVNVNYIFRFPKKPENQKQLEQEISIQSLLIAHSTLPFPKFEFIPSDHSFVGYKKLQGTSLLAKRNELIDWEAISKELGFFLNKLHSINSEEIKNYSVLIEKRSFKEWLIYGQTYFEKTKHLINKHYFENIETFFNSTSPKNNETSVFCHNDLGIEHIFVENNKISGVIDWGGIAITDPACDFARIYRDAGEKVLDLVLKEYSNEDEAELRERAIFYGKCLLFEDLYYGIGQEEYEQKVFDALEWMF